jgi:alpha-amylase
VKNCSVEKHRYYNIKLFENPYLVNDNSNDWPIRFILSSYYQTYGDLGIPDGLSGIYLKKSYVKIFQALLLSLL